MSQVIRFPKTHRAEEFFKFTVRYSDGAEFRGATLEEAFRKQKDVFEPEISFLEYLERLRDRLLFICGRFYEFTTVEELSYILQEQGFIEVYEDFGTLEVLNKK